MASCKNNFLCTLGGLFNLAKTVVSVLLKELECKVVMQSRIKNKSELPVVKKENWEGKGLKREGGGGGLINFLPLKKGGLIGERGLNRGFTVLYVCVCF